MNRLIRTHIELAHLVGLNGIKIELKKVYKSASLFNKRYANHFKKWSEEKYLIEIRYHFRVCIYQRAIGRRYKSELFST